MVVTPAATMTVQHQGNFRDDGQSGSHQGAIKPPASIHEAEGLPVVPVEVFIKEEEDLEYGMEFDDASRPGAPTDQAN